MKDSEFKVVSFDEDDMFKVLNSPKLTAKSPIHEESLNGGSTIFNSEFGLSNDSQKYLKTRNDYKCYVCGLRFNKKRFLKHHMVSHTEIDPAERNFVPEKDDEGFYKCNICQLKINDPSNYKRHYKSMHIRTMQFCDECNFTTTNPDGIRCHKKKMHSQ